MERDTRVTEAPRQRAETYEPPAVEWEEPFDPVAASDPMDPECQINPQSCQ